MDTVDAPLPQRVRKRDRKSKQNTQKSQHPEQTEGRDLFVQALKISETESRDESGSMFAAAYYQTQADQPSDGLDAETSEDVEVKYECETR
jgi:hypothetical protein